MIGLELIKVVVPIMSAVFEDFFSDMYNAVMSPYVGLLGSWTYATIFALVIAAFYIKTESIGPPFAFIIFLLGLELSANVFNVEFTNFLVMIAAVILGVMLVLIYRGRH